MDRTRKFVVLLYITVLCILQTTFGQGIVSSNFVQLPGARTEVCTKPMSCRYAVCRWSRSIIIDPKTCVFVESSCRCPEFEVCMPTGDMVPRSGYFKIEFMCKHVFPLARGITLG